MYNYKYCVNILNTKHFQMALNWIFGGKKKEDNRGVTVEATEQDFIVIQSNNSYKSLYPAVPPSPYPSSQFYTPLPYTLLPQHHGQEAVASGPCQRTNSIQSQLEGVPFILSPKLDDGSRQNPESGLEGLRRAVFQIAADINDSMYDYHFKLEHTIIKEASFYDSNSKN